MYVVYLFFRHNAIDHLRDYTVQCKHNLYALGNQNICVTHFIVIFALLLWSGTKLAISLRHACRCNNTNNVLFKPVYPKYSHFSVW